jgi:DNA-binding transcriptional LysR family regulator
LLEADLLSAEEVGQEQLLVVVGRGHPWFGMPLLQPQQLRDSPWVMRERGSGAQSLLDGVLSEVGVPAEALNVTLVLNSSEMVKAIVLEGGAAAALPETMVRQEVELGLLWPMPIEGCTRHRQPIWMVKHRQRYGSRLLLAFEELVRTTNTAADGLDPGEEIGAGG